MTMVIGVAHALTLVLLVVAAVMALARMAMGPSSLDRSIATDLLTAVTVAGTGLYVVISGSTTALPVLVVLSLIGFTGPVAIARLISSRSAQVRDLRRSTAGAGAASQTRGSLERSADAAQACATVGPEPEQTWDDAEDGEDSDADTEGRR
ncbi:MAG: monovalent cation/H+ antiporter complex subunit F [Actinomyces urogenitalis]|uniref:monovalent cation/H+ antiporter complex subunit F n=1 Tax=Actinomyces urogenitalis TaxID=103621 RepID=UPI002A7F4042|nr:monovalent cation/H+ antiporter complex subunit F [Actinomyces urogenitalis]MDY3678870.1 monovalent cation/H+ antiporter complex subunit F [Actinomyces urogenitalis]